MQEVAFRACVDTQHQSLALLLMALGPEDVSKVRFGKLSNFTIQYLRDIREFFGIVFKIKTDPETGTVL